jgi:hypothetical protein
VRALEKAGLKIIREGKHPVPAVTMGGVVRDAGLSVEEFKKLL